MRPADPVAPLTAALSVADAAPLELYVLRLDPDIALPSFARSGDAGLDLTARESAVIAAGGGRYLMPTGLAIDIPAGHAGFVLPRSGMAARHGLSIVNAPGLIDRGYRGEVIVALLNTDPDESIAVRRGDRIAQLVILAVPSVVVCEVDELSESPGGPGARGTGGYGNSGR